MSAIHQDGSDWLSTKVSKHYSFSFLCQVLKEQIQPPSAASLTSSSPRAYRLIAGSTDFDDDDNEDDDSNDSEEPWIPDVLIGHFHVVAPSMLCHQGGDYETLPLGWDIRALMVNNPTVATTESWPNYILQER
jgi:hypothetical protein